MNKAIKKKVSGPQHPTGKKHIKATYSPSSISIGKKEKALLRHLLDNRDSRFNVRAYSHSTGIPRPTIYDSLNRLIKFGLVNKPHIADHKITEKGKTTLEVLNQGRKSVRRECREINKLSQHYIRFALPRKDNNTITKKLLSKLNPLNIKMITLPNQKQYFIYFDDATIIFTPKQIIIRIHDILSEETEESLFQSISKALSYAVKINKIGCKTDTVNLESSHYARVESILSDCLFEVDKRYYLDLGKGKKFWIDHSQGKREDETNDAITREKIDNLMKDTVNSDSRFSDIDDIKEILDLMLRLKVIEFQDLKKKFNGNGERDKSYFG